MASITGFSSGCSQQSSFENHHDFETVLTVSSPIKVLEKSHHIIDHKQVDCKIARKQPKPDFLKVKKLFVGGLTSSTTEKALRDYFGSLGTVSGAKHEIVVLLHFNKCNSLRHMVCIISCRPTDDRWRAIQRITSCQTYGSVSTRKISFKLLRPKKDMSVRWQNSKAYKLWVCAVLTLTIVTQSIHIKLLVKSGLDEVTIKVSYRNKLIT